MSVRSVAETSSVETNHTDRRSEPRHQCPRLVRVRPVTVPESSFRLSHVNDVSANGIGLRHGSAFAPGTLLEIQLPGCLTESRFARVVHCTKQEGVWLVGCALNDSLSARELEGMMH